MALVMTSNSLTALNVNDNAHGGGSSRTSYFSPLNSSASPLSARVTRAEFSGAECSLSRKVGEHGFRERIRPSETCKRESGVRLNAGSTPESQTADKEADSSVSSQEPSEQSHLDLLHQITSRSAVGAAGSGKTIAQQLAADLEEEGAEEVTIPLGSGKLDIKATDLTISQKRNIARQNYMNKVAERNDAPLFTAVALFVLLPPAAILGVAVATGYVDLFP